MKTIQILGTGCPTCHRLAHAAEQAARDLKLEYRLVKVQDIAEILRFGVLTMPVLAVDGVTKAEGRVPGPDEMKALLA